MEHYITAIKGEISKVSTRIKTFMDSQYVVQREQSDTEGSSRRQRKRRTIQRYLLAVTDVVTD